MDNQYTFIYVLFDPRKPEEVRYVGKTKDLDTRMKCHRKDAKNLTRRYLYNWIRKLQLEGIDFSYKVIEVVTGKGWPEREKYWIKFYREAGHKITNIADGGEGASGVKLTEAQKKNLSEKAKGHKRCVGRVLSDETKAKISKGNKGKTYNKKLGPSGFKYVAVGVRNKWKVNIPLKGDGKHFKYGFKTPEEAFDYVLDFLRTNHVEKYNELNGGSSATQK